MCSKIAMRDRVYHKVAVEVLVVTPEGLLMLLDCHFDYNSVRVRLFAKSEDGEVDRPGIAAKGSRVSALRTDYPLALIVLLDSTQR